VGRKSENEEASKQLLQHATLTRGATPGVDRSELDLFRCKQESKVSCNCAGGGSNPTRPFLFSSKKRTVLLAAECPTIKDHLTAKENTVGESLPSFN
jgi:hypothetical protein